MTGIKTVAVQLHHCLLGIEKCYALDFCFMQQTS